MKPIYYLRYQEFAYSRGVSSYKEFKTLDKLNEFLAEYAEEIREIIEVEKRIPLKLIKKSFRVREQK